MIHPSHLATLPKILSACYAIAMIHVSFHIQDENDHLTPEHFICWVTHQYVLKNHKICILAMDENHLENLSRHLWSFPQDALIPHHIKGNMLITEGPFQHKSVINLCTTPVLNIKTHIIEPVFKDDDSKTNARERYKTYKQKSFDIKHIRSPAYK